MNKLQECDFVTAAKLLDCEVAAIKAVHEVEVRGKAFQADGQPTILFERHKFHKYTQGKFSTKYPDISNPKAGGYGSSSSQHARLQRAVALDRNAALMSASWGAFQIMGFNYEAAGFKNLQSFITAMYAGEVEQLLAFVAFVKSQGLQKYIKSKNWAKFAEGYNGSNYRINKYDEKLAAAYKKFSTK